MKIARQRRRTGAILGISLFLPVLTPLFGKIAHSVTVELCNRRQHISDLRQDHVF